MSAQAARNEGNETTLAPWMSEMVQATIDAISQPEMVPSFIHTVSGPGIKKWMTTLTVCGNAVTIVTRQRAQSDTEARVPEEVRCLAKIGRKYHIYEVGHYPQLQSPELVIEAIQDVLGRCKKEASPSPEGHGVAEIESVYLQHTAQQRDALRVRFVACTCFLKGWGT